MKQVTPAGFRPARNLIPILMSFCLAPVCVIAQATSAPSADNSARNAAHATTADQQSNADSDRLLTQKIRKAIVADKSVSMYGHNVKIITKNGSVTLKGPVHSDEEKQSIGATAAEAAGGADKIANRLTVKQ